MSALIHTVNIRQGSRFSPLRWLLKYGGTGIDVSTATLEVRVVRASNNDEILTFAATSGEPTGDTSGNVEWVISSTVADDPDTYYVFLKVVPAAGEPWIDDGVIELVVDPLP